MGSPSVWYSPSWIIGRIDGCWPSSATVRYGVSFAREAVGDDGRASDPELLRATVSDISYMTKIGLA